MPADPADKDAASRRADAIGVALGSSYVAPGEDKGLGIYLRLLAEQAEEALTRDDAARLRAIAAQASRLKAARET